MTADEEPQLKEKKMKMKICLIGEGAVGKTSLIRRFVLDEFDDKYLQTLGTKVSKKELEIPADGDSPAIQVDMTIWDIMGQKGFRELLKDAYFYGAKGIIAVCDVTRRTTLEELDDWIEGVYSVSGRVPIQFLANKSDLEDKLAMNAKDLEQATKAYDSRYYFTSARTGLNVEQAFRELALRVGKDESTRVKKKG
ncbi:MAG: GTP-binding protein [Thermoplasmata archaeon]|nr:GTP-binding protein [Thermoplasmata archaeon]